MSIERAAKSERESTDKVVPADHSWVVRPKLIVGSGDDPLERDADAMADAVMRALRTDGPPRVRGATPRIQLSSEVGVAGGTLDRGTEAEIDRRRGRGRHLDGELRRSMEGAFGADFSDIRLNVDAGSDALNERIGARAFSIGSDVFVRRSDYRPAADSGRRLIAHELAHTVQQGASSRIQRSSDTTIRRALNPDSKSKGDWNSLQTGRTGAGVNGVIFATNLAGEQIVVKGLAEPPQRAMLAQEMMEKAGLRTTKTKPVAVRGGLGRHILTRLGALGATLTANADPMGAQITAKVNAWANFESLLLMEPANVKNLQELATTGPGLQVVVAPPVWARAVHGGGPDPTVPARQLVADDQANVDLHAGYWRTLLKNLEMWKQFGRMMFIDQFLGNEDRFETLKIQNVFIDNATGDAVAMDNDTMAAEFISQVTHTDAVTMPHNPQVTVTNKTPADHIRGVIEGGWVYNQPFQDRTMGSLQVLGGDYATLKGTSDAKVLALLTLLDQGTQGNSHTQVGAQVAIQECLAANVIQTLQAAMIIGLGEARVRVAAMFNDATRTKRSTFEKLFRAQLKNYKAGYDQKGDAMFNYLTLTIRYDYLERRTGFAAVGHAAALQAVQVKYANDVAQSARTGVSEIDPNTFSESLVSLT